MDLYIIGTHHKHQFGPCTVFNTTEQACKTFALYLKEQCQSLSIRTLAEEMSIDVRKKWDLSQTVPESVAFDLDLDHADCDPDEKERSHLGIQGEGAIKMNGLFHRQSKEIVQENIQHDNDKREYEWIRRLSQLQNLPVLFVCGYDHPSSLLKKARECGLSAQIIVEKWTPNKTNALDPQS
jgi:hypothetical protein